MTEIENSAARLRAAINEAAAGLVEREQLVELIVLAAVAGEHVLIIGPPGTAKSAAARRTAQRLGGAYFEYLLGRFTEPNEIFGPIDIAKLQEGRLETQTDGMLPEADVAFLDEVFLGSTAILNTLLSVLNERAYRRGHTYVRCPLRVCVGASNALPSEESLAAFADRFLVTAFVDATPDSHLEELLEAGWSVDQSRVLSGDDLPAVDVLRERLTTVELDGVRGALAQAVRVLRGAGLALSDRRVVKLQRLIAGAALLDGRVSADGRDLWPIVFAVQSANGQNTARDALRDLLVESRNRALASAAESASSGPAARADRIERTARSTLATLAPGIPVEEDQLRIEALLREIDATFDPSEVPPGVRDVRAELVACLERDHG